MKMEIKKTMLMSMLALVLIAGTGVVQAASNTTNGGQQMHGNMMGGSMMGSGMMGGGMMHGDMMEKNGMMGNQGNWSMGCNGMMGGMMMNQMSHGQQQEFLNQTTDLRRQMMEKRFKYMEAMRNSDASPQDLAEIEKEMLELRNKMMNKMPTLQGK